MTEYLLLYQYLKEASQPHAPRCYFRASYEVMKSLFIRDTETKCQQCMFIANTNHSMVSFSAILHTNIILP